MKKKEKERKKEKGKKGWFTQMQKQYHPYDYSFVT